MKTFRKLLANKQGMILVISLMILSLLLGAGVGAIVSMQTDLRTSSNLKTGKQAFYIGDAGINRAWKDLDASNQAQFNSISTTSPANYLGLTNLAYNGGSYTVETLVEHAGSTNVNNPIPKRVRVTSTGCYPAVTSGSCPTGNAKVVLVAQFRRLSLFNCAVCADGDIAMAGGSNTDSYDSRAGAYNAPLGGGNFNKGSDGDLGTNGNVNVSGSGTEINGDAGAGGTVTAPAGAVTGTTTNSIAPIEFSPVTPCGPPYHNGSGMTGSGYKYISDPTSKQYGELTLSAKETLTLAPGSYCFKSVNSLGEITVNGAVTISVTDISSFGGNGIANTTGVPDNLKIYSSFTSTSSASGLTVTAAGTQTYMVVYAPLANVNLTGNSAFYGSVVGKTVSMTGGASLHYDKKLEDTSDGEVGMVSWRQDF